MKVLVLGATGFIGGHVALEALAAGWQVRCLRRDPLRSGLLGGSNDRVGRWRSRQTGRPEPAFAGVDVVFHAAGYYPNDSKNVPDQVAHAERQMATVLGMARTAGVSRLVYTSSYTTMVSKSRRVQGPSDEGDHYAPGLLSRSAYYECKVAMEQVLDEAGKKDPEYVILNPTMVLGPCGKAQAVGAIFLVVARGWGVGLATGQGQPGRCARCCAARIVAAANVGVPGAAICYRWA